MKGAFVTTITSIHIRFSTAHICTYHHGTTLGKRARAKIPLSMGSHDAEVGIPISTCDSKNDIRRCKHVMYMYSVYIIRWYRV